MDRNGSLVAVPRGRQKTLALSEEAKRIAWKAQQRLYKRFTALAARGKQNNVIVTAPPANFSASCGLSPYIPRHSANQPRQLRIVTFYWTAALMTAEGPRNGEPSRRIVRHGLRTQPASSVRGSSRRIMAMRFQPAHISVINRRASAEAVISPAVQNKNAPSPPAGSVIPPEPPIEAVGKCQNGARRQGFATPRQTPARPCLLRAVPAGPRCDGRLRRDHTEIRYHGGKTNAGAARVLDRVAPYQFSVGILSARSTTSTSTGARWVSNFSPSSSRKARCQRVKLSPPVSSGRRFTLIS
jgi:hypothetical protein